MSPTRGPQDRGKFVAIDVDSGDFEVDADGFAAVRSLRARRPTVEIWPERAGESTSYKMLGFGR